MERMLALTDRAFSFEPDTPGPTKTYRATAAIGTSRKTLKGNDVGALPIDVTRATVDGILEPELIKKGQTRIDGMDDKIIGLYADRIIEPATSAPISEEVYGTERVAILSAGSITDGRSGRKYQTLQNRALGSRMYPLFSFDALRVKIRDAESRSGQEQKPVYCSPGRHSWGDVRFWGLWVANNEGAKFWLSVNEQFAQTGASKTS